LDLCSIVCRARKSRPSVSLWVDDDNRSFNCALSHFLLLSEARDRKGRINKACSLLSLAAPNAAQGAHQTLAVLRQPPNQTAVVLNAFYFATRQTLLCATLFD